MFINSNDFLDKKIPIAVLIHIFIHFPVKQVKTTGKTCRGDQQFPEFQPSKWRVQPKVKMRMIECWTAKW